MKRSGRERAKEMKAVVIVVEGLGAAMVGAYGSATTSTPAIDRLAARSLVLDQCFIDSFDLERQLRSMWTSIHGNCQRVPQWNLWNDLSTRDIPSQLITDSAVAAHQAQHFGCPQITLVDVSPSDNPVAEAEECALMHVFAAAMETLSDPQTEGLVWIHARGLSHSWDAPIELRMAMTDPDDPPPPDEACFPKILVDDGTDPDLIVGWGQVAAAQVAVLDGAIDAIEQTISSRNDSHEWTWLLSSTGGIPLGEHGQVGTRSRVAYSEEIAIPFIIRPHGAPPVGIRRAELCQLPDLPRTLLVAMGIDPLDFHSLWGRNLWHDGAPIVSNRWSVEHTIVWMESDGRVWIRVPAWSLLQDEQGNWCLFVKPDDRWEANDIAARREDIIEALLTMLPQIRHATEHCARATLPNLESMFTSLIR